MTKPKEIRTKKASGDGEIFCEYKLRRSLERARVSPLLIDEVVRHVESKLIEGMSTSEIYRQAYSFLRKEQPLAACQYTLKRAVLELGPTGHPFERLVGEVLKSKGFSVRVGQTVAGFCVFHEVDVIAENKGRQIVVESKFHNRPGYKTDVKVALYVQARFEDIKRKLLAQSPRLDKSIEAWLITNTKLTSDAIRYAECVGLKAISGNYPLGSGLFDLIKQAGLYPLTCLTTLSIIQKKQLLSRGALLCNEIIGDEGMLKSVGLQGQRIGRVITETTYLCGLGRPGDQLTEF
jgi:Holliday junction resolvase-like predicted endonuclease